MDKDHKDQLRFSNHRMKINKKILRKLKGQEEKVEVDQGKMCKKVGLWRLNKLSMTKIPSRT